MTNYSLIGDDAYASEKKMVFILIFLQNKYHNYNQYPNTLFKKGNDVTAQGYNLHKNVHYHSSLG